MEAVLRMRSIHKRFPGVIALDGVDFDLKSGEVHVLIGENGAGKSTLMKILAGLYRADSGMIEIDGHSVNPDSPRAALHLGVAMISQELAPIPDMSVAENVFAGREPGRFGIVDRARLKSDTQALLARLGCDFGPDCLMRDLSVARVQMVEIAKAISRSPRIIIMDEPTSAISDEEVETLFKVIGLLKAEGAGIVYISHRLPEIYRIGDRITVLRDGRLVRTCQVSELPRRELISLMVGRQIEDVFPLRNVKPGREVLRVEGLGAEGLFTDVDFSVRAGEIFGVAGLMGAGRTEVVETIAGARRPDRGQIFLRGEPVSFKSPRAAIRAGISFVTEDRKRLGLNLKGGVRENLSLLVLDRLSSAGVVDSASERRFAEKEIQRLGIRTPTSETRVAQLSGGNQQKVVLARWLSIGPELLVLDEPTRGIDVGAKAEIYALVSRLAEEGMAVVMVSSELPEIVGLCDRVLVMHEGRSMGCVQGESIRQESIMSLATGHLGGCLE